jgi:hypothetical protein
MVGAARKKKAAKKKEGDGLWKLPLPWKSKERISTAA